MQHSDAKERTCQVRYRRQQQQYIINIPIEPILPQERHRALREYLSIFLSGSRFAKSIQTLITGLIVSPTADSNHSLGTWVFVFDVYELLIQPALDVGFEIPWFKCTGSRDRCERKDDMCVRRCIN